MLSAAGVSVHRSGRHVTVANCDELTLDEIVVPGDPSSAAFVDRRRRARARVAPDRARQSANWTRTGFLRIVQRMGGVVLGDLEDHPGDEVARSEPTTDLDVAAGPLVGTEVEADEVPLAIDELPLVALLGCFAEGRDRRARGAASCASRSPTGSPPSSRGCAAWGPTSRRPPTASP